MSRHETILKIPFSKLKISEIWKRAFTRLSVLVQQWDRVRYQVQQVVSRICPCKHGLLALTVAWGWGAVSCLVHFYFCRSRSTIWCRATEERSHCRANTWDTRPTKWLEVNWGCQARQGTSSYQNKHLNLANLFVLKPALSSPSIF